MGVGGKFVDGRYLGKTKHGRAALGLVAVDLEKVRLTIYRHGNCGILTQIRGLFMSQTMSFFIPIRYRPIESGDYIQIKCPPGIDLEGIFKASRWLNIAYAATNLILPAVFIAFSM